MTRPPGHDSRGPDLAIGPAAGAGKPTSAGCGASVPDEMIAGIRLPNTTARFLPGTWHGVSAEHLAPALTEFFTDG
jgi:hypothetical protein